MNRLVGSTDKAKSPLTEDGTRGHCPINLIIDVHYDAPCPSVLVKALRARRDW